MPRTLCKAVVVEVLYDNFLFNQEVIDRLKSELSIKNADQLLQNAPLNSCIVRIFEGAEKGHDSYIAYPFFPPHLSMPVKPGECVWVASPTGDPDPKDIYWLCRITSRSIADDLNYTHWPRGAQGSTDSTDDTVGTREKAAQTASPEDSAIVPGFTNQMDGGKVLKIPTGSSDLEERIPPNPFNTIVESSVAYSIFTSEPVPYFTKKPSDLVLQGSHNTLISLGQDRGWAYADDSTVVSSSIDSNASFTPFGEAPSEGCGTIDIVSGRARYFAAEPTTKEFEGPQAERTNFRIIQNTRDNVEIDKNSVVHTTNDLNANLPASGDPDFAVDASRIYVSMKTSGDQNFGLTKDLAGTPVGFEAAIENVDDAAYIISKSDEIRIIARKQEENQFYPLTGDPEINGSIRIIKEGSNDDDLAAIVLLPDGTIQISGSKIFLGRTTDDGGAGGGPGPGQSQPYVKYQDLEDLWNSTMDALNAFCTTLATHTTPGYGAPSPQILEAAATLQSEISSMLKPSITNVKSDRIFGE
jgi:hypothetical protein